MVYSLTQLPAKSRCHCPEFRFPSVSSLELMVLNSLFTRCSILEGSYRSARAFMPWCPSSTIHCTELGFLIHIVGHSLL